MSFEETALSFWQLCHHSLACFLLSSNSCLWPLSSMQLEVGRVGKVWAANCGFSDVTCCAGLRQFLTKNQVKVHTQVSSNAGRVKCSTLMKTGATILGFLCKTSYTNLAVPKGVFALIQYYKQLILRLPIRRKIDQFPLSSWNWCQK